MRRLLLFGFCGALHCLFALTGCRPAPAAPPKSDPGPGTPAAAPHEPAKEPLAVRLVNIAKGEVGTLEDPLNSNRGARVDEYNLTCGRDYLGAPWCASFARWTFYQAGVTNGVPGAYSPDWFSKKRRVLPENVRPGDQGLIWFNSLGRFAHTIAVVEDVRFRGVKPVEVVCIEGNSNPDGGREGYGVFRRIRKVDGVTFVRWED